MKGNNVPIIEIKNLHKKYMLGNNQVIALNGIDLVIQRGEFMAIAGSSGSGKTTLLNIIGCIDIPTSGDYFLDNEDISRLSESALTIIRRHKIGYIFQGFNLVPVLTAFENVEYPLLLEGKLSRKQRQEKVNNLLEETGIYEQRNQFPNELSGGQKQRVAIARALIKNPDLVLADEPTANLDSITGLKIIELLQKLNRDENVTFIFSSHDQKVIDYAHRIEHICDGQIKNKKGA